MRQISKVTDTISRKTVLMDFLISHQIDFPRTSRLSHLSRKFWAYFPEIAVTVNPESKPWKYNLANALADYVETLDPMDFCVSSNESIKKRADIQKQLKAKNCRVVTNEMKTAFYASWEWRTLRKEVLNQYGARCQCCGATPADVDIGGKPVRIVVDHIKPLARYWSLRLDRGNCQILCDECNMGAGAWDETDHRPAQK